MIKSFRNQPMTVKQLLAICKEEVKAGNGDKHIWLANDDEGNGFHAMFYGFSSVEQAVSYPEELVSEEEDLKHIIILG